MTVAVLSGKGGTGKTTVAASLARVVPDCQYVDADVEEPNGYVFLNPEVTRVEPVLVQVPEIDPDACTLCGACVQVCRFSALAQVSDGILVFPDLCHHCGACRLECETGALYEVDRRVGVIESDDCRRFVQGRLDVGEPVGVPIIRALRAWQNPDVLTVVDCPPGTSCAVVAALEQVDAAVLVTEPTPFGLHDLTAAAAVLQRMGIPGGVIINKAGTPEENRPVEAFCEAHALPVLLRIPFERDIAVAYASGRLPVEVDPSWADAFLDVARQLDGMVTS